MSNKKAPAAQVQKEEFKASQMPIKQRIQSIDVSQVKTLIISEQHQRWYQATERQQERLSALEVGVRDPGTSKHRVP